MYPTAGQAAGAPLAYIHYQYIICNEAKVQYMYHKSARRNHQDGAIQSRSL